jgi:hypothetical protein
MRIKGERMIIRPYFYIKKMLPVPLRGDIRGGE